MKELEEAKRILGIDIIRDRKNGILKLSQEDYALKMLKHFGMSSCKPVNVPLANQFKLSSLQSPVTAEEKQQMSSIPYTSAVGSLMYLMVCTRPDIAHGLSVVSR